MSYPFDLERALKGEAVVTRDGNRVFDISETNTNLKLFSISGFIGSKTHYWSIKGKYLSEEADNLDLFMLNPSTDVDNS